MIGKQLAQFAALRRGESSPGGMRRIAIHEIEAALRYLRRGHVNDAAVHGARRALKKALAALRLLRSAAGGKRLEWILRTLQDISRPLGVVRDSKVLLECLDALPGGRRGGPALLSFRTSLQRARRRLHRGLTPSVIALESARLRACAARLRRLRLSDDSWDSIEPELQRAYGGARRAMRQVGTDSDGRHKWRKRAKVVRYQLGFLEPLWPPVLKTLESQLHRLTDCLGEDHDLSLLRAKLLEDPGFNSPAQRPALLRLIERRRHTLQRNALALGLRIFGEKPHRFSARLRAYWRAWSR